MSLRLPNGPPVFVGRARESDALATAIQRGPVACVWGVGGLGKSTLAFHVLHARFPAQAPRTLFMRLTRGEAIEQALLTLAQTLAAIRGADAVDWRSLLADRDALVATLIDLADGPGAGRGRDAQAHWIMIDDLHHADPARTGEIAGQLARYARRSRFILVGRARIVPEDAPSQAVAIGAMSAEDLADLGACWAQPSPLDERLIAAAAGSPWRLGQLLGGAQPGIEPGTGSLLEGMAPEAAAFLLDLSLVEIELPEETIARFTAIPPPAALADLERRGLIERRPRGIRVHDVARGVLLAATLDARATQEKRSLAAEAICASPDPAARCEGIRLLVEDGAADRAARELDARGAALLEGGQVLGLWRMLEQATAPALASWRLRCATEIGDTLALRGVPMPPDPGPADRVRWALSLFHQSRYKEASLAAAEARAAASDAGDASLAFEGGRIAGRAAQYERRPEEALAILLALAPATLQQAVQHNVDVAACLVELERRDEALARLRAAEDQLAAHPEIGDRELSFGIARLLYELGELRLSERTIERLTSAPGEILGHDVTSTRCLMLATGVAFDRGAVARAVRLLDRISPFALRSSVYSVYATLQHLQLRLAMGSLDGLKADILSFTEAAGKTLREQTELTAQAVVHQLAIALGAPPEEPPHDFAPNENAGRDHVLLWEAIHRAHWGEAKAAPDAVRSNVPEVQILCRIAAAWVALGSGQAEIGLRAAEEATARAGPAGFGLLEAYASEARLVAEILAGAPAATVTRNAAALAAAATEGGMVPIAVQARLLGLLASTATFDPAALERIAVHPAAPGAARRARALLGEEVALDHLDQAVVTAARQRVDCRIHPVAADGGATDGARAWGLDDRTQTVWLPDRACSLAERPLLWRILTTIARAGGTADKDSLVTMAWEIKDYHPLRDDARLHTAVRKLRQLIEDDPTSPRRLVTTEEGYAFGQSARVRRLVPL